MSRGFSRSTRSISRGPRNPEPSIVKDWRKLRSWELAELEAKGYPDAIAEVKRREQGKPRDIEGYEFVGRVFHPKSRETLQKIAPEGVLIKESPTENVYDSFRRIERRM